MNELICLKCKKIIGFTSKKFYKEASNPTIIKCIECYFKEVKGQ